MQRSHRSCGVSALGRFATSDPVDYRVRHFHHVDRLLVSGRTLRRPATPFHCFQLSSSPWHGYATTTRSCKSTMLSRVVVHSVRHNVVLAAVLSPVGLR